MYLIVRTAWVGQESGLGHPEDGPDLLTDLQLVGKTVLSSLTAQFHSVLVPDGYVAAVEPALSAPRHSYVPRAFFAQPNGTVRFDCINPAADRLTPYRYTSAEQLVAAMRTFLAAFREARGTARYPAGLDWDL
ncbi:hypothetical protein HYH03_000339 [Edaphochlamys debaryana]|uniref:Uncharacterized protein n=1 Tax=Edaphochlamys debaryana TaxID=47281 RepID=A0A835YFY8_9CHLO|nr:hypothetical protein HYH03_000339 [Edaphochlamys debaryana]|eukprot:KAG2501841.1 hypothetical protein HYH03_000339 [Edaphochlamys debaryana]